MKARQLYFILVGSLGSLIALGLLSYGLVHGRLDTKISQLRQLNADLIIENQQLANLRKLESQYQEIEPLAKKASGVLPAQKEQDEVVAQVAKIVNDNGLALSGLSFNKTSGLPDERSQTQPAKIGGMFIMPVQFQTEGTYAQLQAMLLSFEKQQRFMRVSTLELTRQPRGQIGAGVILEVFFKP